MAQSFGLPNLTPAQAPHIDRLPRVELSDLETQIKDKLRTRVSHVSYEGKDHIMMVFLKTWGGGPATGLQTLEDGLEAELQAYERLAAQNSTLGPKLLALVQTSISNDQSQIVGFICEKLEGRKFREDDRKECESRLKELHECGFIHSDLEHIANNLVITDNGPKFYNFQHAEFEEDDWELEEGFQTWKDLELDWFFRSPPSPGK